jgi:hypothetical protein
MLGVSNILVPWSPLTNRGTVAVAKWLDTSTGRLEDKAILRCLVLGVTVSSEQGEPSGSWEPRSDGMPPLVGEPVSAPANKS